MEQNPVASYKAQKLIKLGLDQKQCKEAVELSGIPEELAQQIMEEVLKIIEIPNFDGLKEEFLKTKNPTILKQLAVCPEARDILVLLNIYQEVKMSVIQGDDLESAFFETLKPLVKSTLDNPTGSLEEQLKTLIHISNNLPSRIGIKKEIHEKIEVLTGAIELRK